MNDFTKEELLYMKNCMHALFDGLKEPPGVISMCSKLQFMIDNYCDHKWTDGIGNHIYCGLCHADGGKR